MNDSEGVIDKYKRLALRYPAFTGFVLGVIFTLSQVLMWWRIFVVMAR